jgi:hypothetical protein
MEQQERNIAQYTNLAFFIFVIIIIIYKIYNA